MAPSIEMNPIRILLETIKDLIAEATQSQSGYDQVQLIPIPSETPERNLPNNHNQ